VYIHLKLISQFLSDFVDKRGAVIGKTSKEDLRQFYDLSDEDKEEESKDSELRYKSHLKKYIPVRVEKVYFSKKKLTV
jgi:hypothetical protein